MIVDSSVWVDFARRAQTAQTAALREAIFARTAMTTDVVRLEVLAGEANPDRLSSALDACEDIMQMPKIDVEKAAEIYRGCRRAGATIRSINDCLIAAIAMRNGLAVLHADRDYVAIAQLYPLRVVA